MLDPLVRDALLYGNLLSMMSLGLTLTYITSKVPNFAHSSFVNIGAYVSLAVASVLDLNPYIALPFAFLFGGLASMAVYALAIRPISKRGGSLVHLMMATLAAEVIFSGVVNAFADYLQETFRIYSRAFTLRDLDFSFLDLPGVFVISYLLCAVLFVSLLLILTKTRFGVAMRATVENPPLASVLGVNTDLVYTVSWFISGGLAGVSGALLPLWIQAGPSTGETYLLSIFCASVLGGLGSLAGAIAGGLVLGVGEIMITGFLAGVVGYWIVPYRPTIPLIIMSLMLLLMPEGIVGRLQGQAKRKA
jgi:branched-chain amino acid transport system permease protein